jgi:hypothetical protein
MHRVGLARAHAEAEGLEVSEHNIPTDATGVPLAIEAEKVVRSTRTSREAANRERAWLIAVLASCVCDFPLVTYAATVSGHAEACPAELMVSRDAYRRRCAWMTG